MDALKKYTSNSSNGIESLYSLKEKSMNTPVLAEEIHTFYCDEYNIHDLLRYYHTSVKSKSVLREWNVINKLLRRSIDEELAKIWSVGHINKDRRGIMYTRVERPTRSIEDPLNKTLIRCRATDPIVGELFDQYYLYRLKENQRLLAIEELGILMSKIHRDYDAFGCRIIIGSHWSCNMSLSFFLYDFQESESYWILTDKRLKRMARSIVGVIDPSMDKEWGTFTKGYRKIKSRRCSDILRIASGV